MKFELIKLPYSYNSLEPFIDAQTMEIHHSKHHQTYVNNLNAALESKPGMLEASLEGLLKSEYEIPEDIKKAVLNNAGGVYNHNFFWSVMSKDSELGESSLSRALIKKYGSIETFKAEFTKVAVSRFGSGWAWLVLNKNKELEVYSTANQDTPISENKTPLLTLDVWEHAYYLKYQNKRADYIQNWWNVVNWKAVSDLYDQNI